MSIKDACKTYYCTIINDKQSNNLQQSPNQIELTKDTCARRIT